MFDEYKIKIKDNVIKVYTENVLGKDHLFSFPEVLLYKIDLSKELRKAILSKKLEMTLKTEMKRKVAPTETDDSATI